MAVLAGCHPSGTDTPAPTDPRSISVAADSVQLNPYGNAPLTALITFSTAAAGSIFMRVRGKHGAITNVDHLFPGPATHHSLVVAGLYPNHRNTVDLRLLGPQGDTLSRTTLTIQTGSLPPNMPTAITAQSFTEASLAPGMLLISNFSTFGTSRPMTPYIMDAYGDIRWLLDFNNHPQLGKLFYDCGIARLRNGNFFFGDINSARIYEVDLLGRTLNRWVLNGYVFHHQVIEKPDGNFIVTVSKPSSVNRNGVPTVEDYLIEIDRKTGKTLNEWNLKESLDELRAVMPMGLSPSSYPGDWFHGNAVDYDSTDNTIIVSGRTQGVVKLDYDNRVKWILSPHRGWTSNRRGEAMARFLLQPLDAGGRAITDTAVINGSANAPDFEWSWYQHTNSRLPNGDILLFDDGDSRNFNSRGPSYSRAVTYKIDPVAMTVQQTWAYGKERGLATFSPIVSSAQYLPVSNHVLFGPGYQVSNTTGRGGKVVEIDMSTKQVVSEISVSSATGWGFHRATKLPLYP